MSGHLVGYSVQVAIPVAWGEMDAFQHLNNTVFFRYFETARIAYFERLGWMAGPGHARVGPILATASCRFRAPITYPDTVYVGVRAQTLEADRFLLGFRIASQAGQVLAAEGDGLVVSYDYERKAKAPLPETIRQAVLALDGARLAPKP